MKKIRLPDRILTFAILVFVFGLSMVYNCYAIGPKDYYYTGGYEDCINDSGGREGISAVQFACDRASVKRQSGCALWLGAPGDTISTTIKVSGTGNQPIYFYGMCTLNPDTAINITISGDNGSIANIGSMSRTNNWGGDPSAVQSSINVDKFIQGLSGYAIGGGYCRYMRTIRVGRTHGSDPTSSHAMNQPITLDLPGECPAPTPVPDPDLCMTWTPTSYINSLAAGATSFVTSVDTRVRNRRLSNDYDPDVVYAMPTDRIEWYTCYYPGAQPANDKPVSEVKPNGWKGYDPLDHETCQPDATVKKEALYLHWPWQNQYILANDIQASGIPHNDFTGAELNVNRVFPRGETDTDGAKNEVGTVFLDAGHKYTETSKTGDNKGPAELTVADGPFSPESSYDIKKYAGEGTCSKLDNGVEKIKVSGTLYPVCSATATFPDASAPLKGLESDGATACWKKTDVCKKQCSDCGADATCAASCCNTCDEVDDSYQCLTESCTNKYADTNTIANITKETTNDNASVIIPYNFVNTTEVSVVGNTVFSGETLTVRGAEVLVGVKNNGKTRATYATIVRDARIQLVGYVTTSPGGGENAGVSQSKCDIVSDAKQCAVLYEAGPMDLNPSGDLGGASTGAFDDGQNRKTNRKTFSTFDASAGDYVCVKLGVYPYTSGADDNWNDTKGSDTWYWSVPSCTKIAKRPTFQVWGGDMYSKVEVENKFADKRNVYANYWENNWRLGNKFDPNNNSITHFGSWVQEGLVLGVGGSTNTIASGAALGERDKPEKANTGNEGGLCDKMAPLTFSNNCNNDGTAVSANVGSLSGDPKSLINYWISNPDRGGISGTRDLDDLWDSGIKQESATETEIRHLKINGSLNITGGEMRNSRTLLIDYRDATDGKVTISGNIKYGTRFNSLGQVPKLIIYAKDIDISCNVTEIDAILIADSRVNTCYDGGSNESNSIRMTPLKIVGTVIVNGNPTRTSDGNTINGGITLGRTYGAAAWKGSGENGQQKAAEIFDYDSTILMWSEYMSSSAQTDTLQTVYQHELAPRY